MSLAEWKTMRKTWTDARDKLKVAKGAVSNVSIGDTIDLVAKASTVGLAQTAAAAAKLLEKIKTYKAGLKTHKDKKYDDLSKWIEQNLEKKATELQTHCLQSITMLKDIKTKTQAAIAQLGGIPSGHVFANALEASIKNKTTWAAEAKQGLADLAKCGDAHKKWAAALKPYSTANILLIEGKSAVLKAVASSVDDMEKYGTLFKTLSAMTDLKQFMEAKRGGQSPDGYWPDALKDQIIDLVDQHGLG